MSDSPTRSRRLAIALLIAAPITSLFISGISWLHYGIDLPFFDDIRPYEARTATSLALKDLFTPANDTLYPVGMALDALAQRYLGGNSVAYQFISMFALLGSLLWLQWRLLRWALGDQLQAAAAFVCCLLMTWPGSYWGLQNLAYHHGLPLLFLLSALALILTSTWAAWWRIPAVFALGLLAGFSYISGAFATLAAGSALLCLSVLLAPRFPALRASGTAFLGAGLATASAQAWVLLFHQHGHIHNPATPWTWPIESAFWMYILGKVGAALALPSHHPGMSLTIVMAILGAAIWLSLHAVRRLAQNRATASEPLARTAVVFFTLLAVMAAYLPLLAAGRAHLEAPEPRTLMAMFVHGFFPQYHAFWVTTLIPWVVATGLAVAGNTFRQPMTPLLRLAPVAAAAVVIGAGLAGAFSHSTNYRYLADVRLRTDVPCIRHALDTGTITCPNLYGPRMLSALTYARQIGSSFVRYFPYKAVPLGVNDPPPLFRLSESPQALGLTNLAPPLSTAEGFEFQAEEDPIFEIALPAGEMAACWELEVTLALKPDREEFAQLYVTTDDAGAFIAPPADTVDVHAGDFSAVTLRAYSLEGFKDRLRLDPVSGAQRFTVKDLEVRCRANVPAPNG